MKASKIISYCIALVLIMACGDMNEIHQKYLDEGEQIYISIADSLTILSGNERAIVKWKIDADPKLKDCVVKWTDTDSVTVVMERTTTGAEWFSKEINLIPEGTFVFQAYNTDIYGNKSLIKEKSQRIYGPNYVAGLSARRIASMELYSEDNLIMIWNTMDECVGVDMHYQNNQDEWVDLFIAPDEIEIVLTDIKLGSEFYYETRYQPADNIDEFVTESKYMEFPAYFILDRSTWTATASSDATHKNDGGSASVVLDGNYDNYWHSSWDPDAQFPHWIIIDMGSEYEIKEVQVYKRKDNSDCKDLNIQLSLDNVNYQIVGEHSFDMTQTPNGGSVILDEVVTGRYLKCEITSGWRSVYVSISEIVVKGKPLN